jgi:DNA-binding XRE family transcriptional regulator
VASRDHLSAMYDIASLDVSVSVGVRTAFPLAYRGDFRSHPPFSGHPDYARMNMKLNHSHVRALREQRAPSQEHLCDASGVAARTVQRVEAGGSASYETAQALAAVFGTDVTNLQSAGAEV